MVDEPVDPFSEMTAGTAQMHEMYQTFIQVGFSEDRAFALIMKMWEMSIQLFYLKQITGDDD